MATDDETPKKVTKLGGEAFKGSLRKAMGMEGVYVVTEPRFQSRKVIGVAENLDQAKRLVLKALGINRDIPFRWVDYADDQPQFSFALDRGHMNAVVDGTDSLFYVQWFSVQRSK